MSKFVSYYDVLQVSRSATFEEIRLSYRTLVLKYHPDKENGDNESFLTVSKAWSILSHPELRQKYDSKLLLTENESIAVADMINIDDFEYDGTNYYYSCRCSDDYIISKFDADLLTRYVNCTGCSSVIEVSYT